MLASFCTQQGNYSSGNLHPLYKEKPISNESKEANERLELKNEETNLQAFSYMPSRLFELSKLPQYTFKRLADDALLSLK